MSATIEPRGIVKSTSSVATRPPNSFRTFSATSRLSGSGLTSVVRRIPIGERALRLHVVERRVVHALLELDLVSAFRDQPRRPEEHHRDDDRAVDAELVLRRIEV